jgi:hypothetical protein
MLVAGTPVTPSATSGGISAQRRLMSSKTGVHASGPSVVSSSWVPISDKRSSAMSYRPVRGS